MGRTDDPKQEEKGDEAWCQYRDHGLNSSTECTHRHPGHHPVNHEAPTTITRGDSVNIDHMRSIRESIQSIKGDLEGEA